MNKAPILWITGIPASGKTTLARHIVRHFRNLGQSADMVDGDEIRVNISPDLGFSKADRIANNRRISWIARLLCKNSVIAVVASVSPYLECRAEARQEANAQGIQFIEIYAQCSVLVARARDVKGLYNTKPDVTGLGAPYEAPVNAEIVVDTNLLRPEDALQEVIKTLPRLEPPPV